MKTILILGINWFCELIILLLFLRAILSWFARDPYSTPGKAYQVAVRLTEPIVMPCRELIYKLGLNTGPLDFSVFIAFFLVEIIGKILVRIIWLLPF